MALARVLIVDDSRVVRSVLREILSQDPDIEVVGEAEDPFEARDKIKALKPNVLTLDVEMPRMDGITFLRNLMRLNPMPVVMLSSLTGEGAETTLKALEIGAVDYMPKPTTQDSEEALEEFQREVIRKIKSAAFSANKVKHLKRVQTVASHTRPAAAASATAGVGQTFVWDKTSMIAIGSSTGGTEALKDVLTTLPRGLPPIVIAQHIPESFSRRLAERLDRMCEIKVQEATHNQVLEAGCAYIAPGHSHLRVERVGGVYRASVNQDDPINRHRPSVEALFDSLLKIMPEKVTAVMLTGMGEDGAKAMKRLYDNGAYTIAQDEQSSLVWGMPGAAVKYGGVSAQVSLPKIGDALAKRFAKK